MKFKRKFKTCDPEDNAVQNGTTKLIYAFHPDDPFSEDNIPPHDFKSRGARSALLLNTIDNIPKLPDDTKTLNFTANKITLQPKRTTYYYRVFQFPKLQKRHDIIQIDAIIQEGNEGIIHHMILSECSDDFPKSYLNYEGTLDSPDMPAAVKECAGPSVIAAWAIGGQSLYYPEHVGFSIGEHNSPKIAVLEIHYNNYELKAGVIDSSGIRVHYTSQLRRYQAAVLTIGLDVPGSIIIPPYQDNWTIEGYCVKECTAEGLKGSSLPGGGIRIFVVGLHTHSAGRAVYVRHVRNGVELPEINRDDHYDFNFQASRNLRREITVLPGDSLTVVCKYQTEESQISGGLGTDHEMCLSFLAYYPKLNLTRCLSSYGPAWNKFHKTHEGVDVENHSEKWTDKMISELRKSYQDTNDIYAYCRIANSKPLPGYKKTMLSKPVINTPLKKEPDLECFPNTDNTSDFVSPGD